MSPLLKSAALVLTLTIAGPALAQQPELKPKKLAVAPAKAPVPALKYRLLPEVKDLEPGNAATWYLRAIGGENAHWFRTDGGERLHELLEMPFEQFKLQKKTEIFVPPSVLGQVELGAHREYCDWDLLTRLRKDGFGTLLPEVQSMRTVGVWLGYRCRLELAEGRFEKAVETLQTRLAMSRHIAEGPTFINALVAAFVVTNSFSSFEDFIEQPNAPNLYWSLTALPRPFIDIRKAAEAEKLSVELRFPELKKLEKVPLSTQEIQRLANICCGLPGDYDPGAKDAVFSRKMELVGKIVQHFPTARQALLDQGRQAKDLDAMTMLQVVLIHNYRQYQLVHDDMLKWTYLPFWEGHKASQPFEAERRLTMFPFGSLLAGFGRMHFASIGPDRRIAALRCIEALRMHVAETGKVPGTLDEITIVPIPIDPATGKQFHYKASGNTVTLFGPAPPGMAASEGNVVNYEITIKR